MRIHRVEHRDCFPDGVLVWMELTDLSERYQVQAREIDGEKFSPTDFGFCAFWDLESRSARLITDTDPETERGRNVFYIDAEGEKHWFEIDLSPELMEQVQDRCREEAALALEVCGAQDMDSSIALSSGPVM
jgi:hypothetical protein|nr:hypothetical protein [uncultured Oscillibacter sp.]